MADVGVVYTLTSSFGTITFNEFTEPFIGNNDQYYLNEIRGLESPALRTPTDAVPLGDGALVHDYWYGATHITFDGLILVQSTGVMDDIVEIRNEMTSDLKAVLDSILRSDGTLTFTPQGESLQTITGLRYEVGLQVTHSSNYLNLEFSFGLVTGTPYS